MSTQPVDLLRQLARGNVHGGYRWAMVAADGELVCETCVRENYRQILRHTKTPQLGADWQFIGLTNSGEHEDAAPAICAHCNKTIFEGISA